MELPSRFIKAGLRATYPSGTRWASARCVGGGGARAIERESPPPAGCGAYRAIGL
jgi:hypothetical protein